MIESLRDNRKYIGSAVSMARRKYEHFKLLKRGTHHSRKLQNFTNKYGVDSLRFKEVESCQIEMLIEREQFWIESFDSYRSGFNENPIAGSCLGRILSKETKDKISTKAIGRIQSDDTIQKRVMKNTGKRRPPNAVVATSSKTRMFDDDQALIILNYLFSGMKQMEIANKLGISQGLVSRIKRGVGVYKQAKQNFL